jgi:FAD/FMN-containing dehydrogenase
MAKKKEATFDYTVLATCKGIAAHGVRIIIRGDRTALWINALPEQGDEVCILRIADLSHLEVVDESGRSVLTEPKEQKEQKAASKGARKRRR